MLFVTTNIREVFDEIAIMDWLPAGRTKYELAAFADEDHLGGRDTGQFPIGVSINAWEGKILYALVRMLRPETCLEIGCADGCSAAHILLALERNGTGQLVSIDTNPACGEMIPPELRSRWTLVVGDGTRVEFPERVDFAFEDASHDLVTTSALLERLKATSARVIASHDYWMIASVREAFDQAFRQDVIRILLQETITGMGLWMKRE